MISGMTSLIDHYVTDGASMVRFQNGLTDLKGNGKESDNTKFLHRLYNAAFIYSLYRNYNPHNTKTFSTFVSNNK